MTVWQQLFTRRMAICVFTGFASGLPLYLLFNLLPVWLRSEQVDLKTIGLFALIQFPYTWKFLWSPLLDRYVVPVLGQRRGWMLITESRPALKFKLVMSYRAIFGRTLAAHLKRGGSIALAFDTPTGDTP